MGIITFPHCEGISSCLSYVLSLPVQALIFLKAPCHFFGLTLPTLNHCHHPITKMCTKAAIQTSTALSFY